MALDGTPVSALETRSLRKAYGAVEVLHDINIDMGVGEFLVLVGPSGCGKSTLLNCIAGLEDITGGSLHIGSRNVTQEPPKDRDIAMVFQSYALYPTMSVAENIGFGMKIRKTPRPEMERRIAEVADLLQIAPLLDRKPSQLSGGQRQRVAMGRALVRDPKLFLFDEPLSNLDAKLRVEMRAEIKRLHQQTGASIVYVTHDQVEAMTLATRIAVLKEGYVQQIGTPAQIYHEPANTFVAEFMGAPTMNLVPGRLDEGSLQIGTFNGTLMTDASLGEVTVGIRPEHFCDAKGEEAGVFEAVCLFVENTGADNYVSFDWNGVFCTARLPGGNTYTPGQSLLLGLDVSKTCIFDQEDQRVAVSDT